jgi:hypothetical protein
MNGLRAASRAWFWGVFALTFALAVGVSLLAAGGGGVGALSAGIELLAPPPSPTVLTINAQIDSYVDDEPSLAGSNFGGSAMLRAAFYGEFDNTRRFFVKFDLSGIPAGSQIESAAFRAYQNYSSGLSPVGLNLYRVTASWTEYGLTWNNQPGRAYRTAAWLGASNGWQSWDVLSLVRDWKDGTYSNYGLQISGASSGTYYERRFSSREGGTPPQLRVTFFPPTPTPTKTGTRTRTPTMTRTGTLTPVTPSDTPTRTVTATRTPTLALPDLRPMYIEVNQAIEGDPFFFDPIWHKPTVVRVYFDTGLPPGSACVRNVTAWLELWRGGVRVSTLFPFNGGGVICAPALADPFTPPDWRQLENALNFEIPDRYLEGTLELRPYVNYDRRVAETNYDNNQGMIRTIHFRELEKRISIAYVPVHYHPAGYAGAQDPSARIDTADWFLKATWPIRPDYVDYYPAPIPDIDWTEDVNVGCAAGTYTGGSALLRHIGELWEDLDPQPDHLYGWLPSGLFCGNGLASTSGNLIAPAHRAFGNDTDGSVATSRYRRTMAHELEHNYGYSHDCDTLGGRGFDVTNRVVKTDTLLEVMCAGLLESQAWADIDTYWEKYQSWGYYGAAVAMDAAPVKLATPVACVIASGLITRTEQGALGWIAPLQRVTRSYVPTPTTGQEYALVFRDGQGQELARSSFDVTTDADIDAEGEALTSSFVFTALWPEGTQRVQLVHGATILDERAGSAHAPQVTLSEPNGGEFWQGVQTIKGAGLDEDGDALSYALLYSRDGGASWTPLTTGQSGSSYTLDTGALPGGTQCLVKVRASDGFHSREDVSDAFLAVPMKAPLATISLPTAGVSYNISDTLTLVGQGYDPEDGVLPDLALEWYLDGQLVGTGRRAEAANLSRGYHLLELRAIDSDKMVGLASRLIAVGPFDVQMPLTVR